MGELRDRLIEDMKLRRYGGHTLRKYTVCIKSFIAYHRRPADQMGLDEVRAFLLHLIEERRTLPATHHPYVAALKFLFGVTLGRRDVADAIPWPKVPVTLPDMLSGTTEVETLAQALRARRPGIGHPSGFEYRIPAVSDTRRRASSRPGDRRTAALNRGLVPLGTRRTTRCVAQAYTIEKRARSSSSR